MITVQFELLSIWPYDEAPILWSWSRAIRDKLTAFYRQSTKRCRLAVHTCKHFLLSEQEAEISHTAVAKEYIRQNANPQSFICPFERKVSVQKRTTCITYKISLYLYSVSLIMCMCETDTRLRLVCRYVQYFWAVLFTLPSSRSLTTTEKDFKQTRTYTHVNYKS